MILVVIVNLIVTLFLAFMLMDQYHKPREVVLKPGQVDESLLKPDAIDKDAVLAHAYNCLTLVNGFTPNDIQERFNLAFPMMVPELARQTKIINEELYKIVEKQNVHHNFRVVAFPKNGPIEIVEGAYWSVTFLGRLESSTGGNKGTEVIRDESQTKVLEVYIERRDSNTAKGKGLFVKEMIHYTFDQYKELKEERGEENIFADYKGIIYREGENE